MATKNTLPEIVRKKTLTASNTSVFIAFILVSLFYTPAASAFQFKYDDINGFLDTTVSSGVSMRVAPRSDGLIGKADGGTAFSVDGDDGDLNYSKGGVFAAVTKATHDLGLSYNNLSGFMRASYFYDPVNLNKKELTPNEREAAGEGFRILDGYGEAKFEPGGHKLDVRYGKQVLNWGESLYIPGGINVINPVDLSKLHVPGAEIREALLPSLMFSDSLELTDRASLENFVLFRYDRSLNDVGGTYFATDNITTENVGGQTYTGFGQFAKGTPGKLINRVSDERPSNNGQWGTALRYQVPEWNGTEFAFYFINSDMHSPVGSTIARNPGSNPDFVLQYLPDIQTYGTSFNTELGTTGISFQGEYSYKPGMPLQIETNELVAAASYFPGAQVPVARFNGDEIQGYRRKPIHQLQGLLSKDFGEANPFHANDWTLSAEAAMIDVGNFPRKTDLRFEAPGTNLPAYVGLGAPQLQYGGWADAFSWGYVLASSCTYDQVIRNVNLVPRVAFSHNVNGTTPAPLGNFVSGRLSATFGLTAYYLESWSVDASFTKYDGASNRNVYGDRDFVSVTVKHWF